MASPLRNDNEGAGSDNLTIEILYLPDCQNYLPALRNLREAMHEDHVAAPITHIAVCDQAMAERVGFLGSPTIRVNGNDIEPAARSARDVGMCCRRYGTTGVPPVAMIRQALREARRQEEEFSS